MTGGLRVGVIEVPDCVMPYNNFPVWVGAALVAFVALLVAIVVLLCVWINSRKEDR